MVAREATNAEGAFSVKIFPVHVINMIRRHLLAIAWPLVQGIVGLALIVPPVVLRERLHSVASHSLVAAGAFLLIRLAVSAPFVPRSAVEYLFASSIPVVFYLGREMRDLQKLGFFRWGDFLGPLFTVTALTACSVILSYPYRVVNNSVDLGSIILSQLRMGPLPTRAM